MHIFYRESYFSLRNFLPAASEQWSICGVTPSEDIRLKNHILTLDLRVALKLQIKEFSVLLVSSLHCRAAHSPAFCPDSAEAGALNAGWWSRSMAPGHKSPSAGSIPFPSRSVMLNSCWIIYFQPRLKKTKTKKSNHTFPCVMGDT